MKSFTRSKNILNFYQTMTFDDICGKRRRHGTRYINMSYSPLAFFHPYLFFIANYDIVRKTARSVSSVLKEEEEIFLFFLFLMSSSYVYEL